MAAENFENLPNFRQAGGVGLKNKHCVPIRDGLLYRSSRTDFVTDADKSVFSRLGIKSIVDLRRQSEYERSDGDKLLDSSYPVYVLKNGVVERMKPSLRWGAGSSNGNSAEPCECTGKRYLVNMWTMDIIWHIFMQANFIVRWLSILLVVFDWITGLHLFVKLYTWMIINNQSVAKQYIDILEKTKPVIADILRLMIQQDTLPMLIHCAHGKDRTGIIVAVVLGLLEVDDKLIIDDYARSKDGLHCIKDRVYQEVVERYGFKVECTYAERDTMEQVLAHIQEKYGTMSEYLLSAGFTLKEQESLKAVFLEQ